MASENKYRLNRLSDTTLTPKPWAGRIPSPPNRTPYEFQLRAAGFALERNHSYLALDPGLGKTIIASLILNALPGVPVVYVCPPSLVINTQIEMSRWCIGANHKVIILPDSMLVDPLGYRNRERDAVLSLGDDGGVLFIDEAHRFSNLTAQRTQSLIGASGISSAFDKVVLMSGTPMRNRPMDLFAPLNRFAPDLIDHRDIHRYGMRYCAGKRVESECPKCHGARRITTQDRICPYCRGRGHFQNGYDYTGASRVEELAERIHNRFMLRIRKSEVLTELPPKTEEIVILSADLPPSLGAVERAMLATHSPADLMQHLAPNGSTSTYRHQLGLVKVPHALAFINDILEDTTESVLVFAEHIKVIERLAKGLARFTPQVITGKTPKDARSEMVKTFQSNDSLRVFIGNTAACGEGFTLTKATRVIHVEPSWVPAVNDQAADRAHRIGQTHQVHVQYLVFKNSIDRKVIETNLRKRQAINLI